MPALIDIDFIVSKIDNTKPFNIKPFSKQLKAITSCAQVASTGQKNGLMNCINYCKLYKMNSYTDAIEGYYDFNAKLISKLHKFYIAHSNAGAVDNVRLLEEKVEGAS